MSEPLYVVYTSGDGASSKLVRGFDAACREFCKATIGDDDSQAARDELERLKDPDEWRTDGWNEKLFAFDERYEDGEAGILLIQEHWPEDSKQCDECLEQARLLGMSAEREASLLAKLAKCEAAREA